ncbi:hypothetical protein Tco_0678633 [Tanacetum coccineum]|uniref:Uncharacterized protein n=1 Tax=Tanacetum coccineum TaxID=301880 RepID=A0ABQ4XFL2_9ASTR
MSPLVCCSGKLSGREKVAAAIGMGTIMGQRDNYWAVKEVGGYIGNCDGDTCLQFYFSPLPHRTLKLFLRLLLLSSVLHLPLFYSFLSYTFPSAIIPHGLRTSPVEETVVLKFDKHTFTSNMTIDEVNSIAEKYGILLDLRPRVSSSTMTMNKLSADVIGSEEALRPNEVIEQHTTATLPARTPIPDKTGFRSNSGTIHSVSPINTVALNENVVNIIQSEAGGSNQALQSDEHIEEEAINFFDNKGIEVNSPYPDQNIKINSSAAEMNVDAPVNAEGSYRHAFPGRNTGGDEGGSFQTHISPSTTFIPS